MERVGAIIEANGDVAEIIVIPSLFNDGMSFSQSFGNQIIGMNADMPILESNLLHIKLFSVPNDNLTLQEFTFPHDLFGLLLSLIDNDGYSNENHQE